MTHRVVRQMTYRGSAALVLHGDANPADIRGRGVRSGGRARGRRHSGCRLRGVVAGAARRVVGVRGAGRAPCCSSSVRLPGPSPPPSARLDGAPPGSVRATGRDARDGRPAWAGPAVAALLLVMAVAMSGGATLQSAAIFTASVDLGNNTFTTGSWAPNDYRSVATAPWSSASTWQRYNGTAWGRGNPSARGDRRRHHRQLREHRDRDR